MLNILLAVKDGCRTALEGCVKGHRVDTASGSEPLIQRVRKNGYHVIILEDRIELLKKIKEADPRAEIFLISGDVDGEDAVALGASVYFKEPVDAEAVKKALDAIDELVNTRRETAELEKRLSEKYTFAGVVGRNPRMLEIFGFMRRIAPYFKTVTVMGETGVGKEEIARALHSISPGSGHQLVVCNCASLVESLIESELFGHKKGSFTGAVADRPGVFEAAGEGTVFLDEIGDLPLSFQPHLLRVLQNGDFRRVGSNQPLKARCRVIAATNKDIAGEVREGRFREDLFFRLMPLSITVPPLRERKDDIPLLCRRILERFSARTGKKILGISARAQAALMGYEWPGNVRELENIIEHTSILTEGHFIGLDDLPDWVWQPPVKETGSTEKDSIKTLDEVVIGHIEAAIRKLNGNRTEAARALGISRRALFRKMEKYSIDTGGAYGAVAQNGPDAPKAPGSVQAKPSAQPFDFH